MKLKLNHLRQRTCMNSLLRSTFMIMLISITCSISQQLYAKAPQISLGVQYSTYHFWDDVAYDSNTGFSGYGLTSELGLFEQSIKKPHHLNLHLGWRTIDQEFSFFHGMLYLQRNTLDLGLSYRYELWSWLHPYVLTSAGLAFDSLSLEFSDESFEAQQDALFHATVQLGAEMVFETGNNSYPELGLRLLYIFDYTHNGSFVARTIEPLPPQTQGVTLGQLNRLGYGMNFIAFIRF